MATLEVHDVHVPADVGSMPPPLSHPIKANDMLKRPLEVSSFQLNAGRSIVVVEPPTTTASVEHLHKKPKLQHQSVVSSDDDEAGDSSSISIAKKKKKLQMKYDPDVPMSREAATAWRREQRRKRNRESAAASRQRQRDRITELKAEVDQYKKAYEAVLVQIKALEGQNQQPQTHTTSVSSCLDSVSPGPISTIFVPASPNNVTFLDLNAGDGIVDKASSSAAPVSLEEQQHQQQPPFKMISRHAVKNHSPTFGGIATLCPESCLTAARLHSCTCLS